MIAESVVYVDSGNQTGLYKESEARSYFKQSNNNEEPGAGDELPDDAPSTGRVYLCSCPSVHLTEASSEPSSSKCFPKHGVGMMVQLHFGHLSYSLHSTTYILMQLFRF